MRDPFARFAGFVYKWRWAVLAFWFIAINALAPIFAPGAAEALKGGGLILSGTESAKADDLLGSQFNLSSQKNVVAVFRSASATVDSADFRDQVTSAATRLKSVSVVDKVTTFYDSKQDSFVSSDKHTTIAVIVLKGDETEAERAVPKLRDQLKATTLEHYLVGNPAAAVDAQSAAESDLRRSELVTLPLIIIMLLIIFRTVVAALVPLILGVFSVGLSVSLLGIIGKSTDISVFALNVGSLIGLGLSIDYTLIILTRYREELAIGHEPFRALAITMSAAGRSIVYSALTVVVAMAVITALLAPIMVLRSISFAVLLVALLAVVLAMTLLPAMMGVLKHRLEWFRVIPRSKGPRRGETGIWYRFSQLVMRRPWVWLALCLVILIPLGAPISSIAFGAPTPAKGTEVAKGQAVMQREFAAGRVAPVYLVVTSPSQDGVWTPDFLAGIRQISKDIAADSRVAEVDSLSTAFATLSDSQFQALTKATLGRGQPAAAPFVNLDGRNDSSVLTVISRYSDSDNKTTDLVHDLRAKIVPGVSKLTGDTKFVGGQTAVIYDFRAGVFGRFPLIALAVAIVILLILMMFFQSIALPIKAVLMNLLSIAATFGVLSLVFQHGFAASLLGFTSADYITVISPGILYVILFALSTDYEVFMLARVKEYYQNFGNNEEAVASGLQHTAGIITAAGLILVVTFGSFLVSNTVVLKEIGLGLAVGVLVDSTIVRVVMVPATMRLLGDRNWWMPAWLKRIIPEIKEGGAEELAEYTEAAPAPAGTVAAAPAPMAAGAQAAPFPPAITGAPVGVGVGAGVGEGAEAGGGQTMAMPVFPGVAPSSPLLGPAALLVSGNWDGIPKIPLFKDHSTRFGRLSSNEIHLPSLAVSRWHARIDFVDGQYRITDLSSTNGVYLNGVRIRPRPESAVLRPGDHLIIGGYPNVAFTLQAS